MIRIIIKGPYYNTHKRENIRACMYQKTDGIGSTAYN